MPEWGLYSGRGATHFKERKLHSATGAIAETVLYTEPGWLPGNTCASSRISWYLCTVQVGTGGLLKLRIKWTDNSGVRQSYESGTISTNSLGTFDAQSIFIHAAYGADVTYELIETGAPSGYLYDLFLHAEHL